LGAIPGLKIRRKKIIKQINTMRVSQKETKFGYFANSGVRDSLFARGSITPTVVPFGSRLGNS
jgi:hypothetical protein